MAHRSGPVGVAALLGVLLLPSAGSADPHGALSPASGLQAALLGQVNALRERRGLSRVRLSTALDAAASGHSVQMARLGYFSHNSANGTSFSGRIARYYPARGYRSWSVGENLLWASPEIGAARALRLWLSSPEHRAILLSPRWRDIGLSAVHSTSAPGVYRGSPVTIVTADFGARSR
ncbi:MAG TPA: CAP domain-containing protein [Gaiellaceae bacterium]|jgi:uncharacterized protein YkwD|nr:CAP domain-containing protein [Gaiellales bacterium]HYX88083.1 CAP domain-containing protein [Gaiellaceae bacterium]